MCLFMRVSRGTIKRELGVHKYIHALETVNAQIGY